jgi:predicted Rossmann fold flavoprotein
MEQYDTVIVGAGAAGLFCAGSLLAQGPTAGGGRIAVLDHARAPGEKIRISGGGRCNFTNLEAAPDRYLSENPRFCASALAGFTTRDFVDLVDRAGIAWHEKALGQLFCDGSARQVTDMLLNRMRGCDLRLETQVAAVEAEPEGFLLRCSHGSVRTRKLVIASGGKSIPKMGATGIGHDIAARFGLGLIELRPGLVPLTFATQDLDLCRPLAGLSLEAEVTHVSGRNRVRFRDGLLFTHRGLSGPAILQISSFWRPGESIFVDLAPGADLTAELRDLRGQGGRVAVSTVLSRRLPARLAEAICVEQGLAGARLADQGNVRLDSLGERIHHWQLRPVGSEGWRTAEVTVGGVDTRALDSRSMQARAVPGLYFIGEVVDVTGWLGGYNFQWAWASAHAAARAISAS